MRYEWDPAKDEANIATRGLSLALAELLFNGTERIAEDDRFQYGETRMVARGLIDGRLFVCVYTDRDDVRRIISLRKANRREQDAYRAGE
ncbi:BrnT family toxin [Azospirillum sp. SYSU D00513]|uniref:BrnT family toxin n=1 Tax=Azospirillum sp. SYSU D00513 TaxID=2812561 RepID=UPI001A95DEC6|nr:BrnT family toxin [Azospirillum sp. SYSU D00513]